MTGDPFTDADGTINPDTGETDMEAKARELWKLLDTDEPNDNQIEILGQYLTEAHNAGMEEGRLADRKYHEEAAVDLAKLRYRQGMEEAAKVAEAVYPPAHTFASENADRYRTQDEASKRIAAAIREKIKG